MASVPKMTLYQGPRTRSFKCLWLIYELGIQDKVELVTVHPLTKDTEEYKAYLQTKVHPHGTTPALVVEGEGVILESTAICLYLADLYGKLVPPLDKRREFYDWILYSSITMEDILQYLFTQWRRDTKDQKVEGVAAHKAKWEVCLERLEKNLMGRDYVLGDSFSVADCIVGFSVYISDLDLFKKGSLVDNKPQIKAYIQRISERPAFQAARKAEGKSS